MTTVYNRSLSGDFGGNLDSWQFHQEIQAEAGIDDTLIGVNVNQDAVEIVFATTLDAGEVTLLDAVIAAHPSNNIPATDNDNTQQFYEASDGQSTTTSATWREKVRLNFVANDGDYSITWYAEVRSSDNRTLVETRIQQDDLITLAETNWAPDNTQNSVGFGPVSGTVRVTLAAGEHDFDIDYRSSRSGREISIRRARITAIRVA